MIAIFLSLTLAYLLFLILLQYGLSTMSNLSQQKKLPHKTKVSVIVAARNEEDHIAVLLRALLNQSYPRDQYEIIIADDESTDKTGDIIRSITTDESIVKYLKVSKSQKDWSNKKWALYQGVNASSGEILLFTDADCTMGTEWISQMTNCFIDKNIGMVAAPSPLVKSTNIWDRMLLLDSIGLDALAAGGISRNIPLTTSGRNLAVRRTAFEDVGGYREIQSFVSGDDDLMMHKIAHNGWLLRYCFHPDAEVKSPPPENLKAFIRQRLRFASKGKSYFNLPFVSRSFRWMLLFIFLTNLGVVSGQVITLFTSNQVWLLPWFIKILGDGILIYKYTIIIKRPFDITAFLLNEIWHGFYVVVLGTLGSFLPISWKERRNNIKVA